MPYFPNGSDPRLSRFESDCHSCPYGELPCPIACTMLIHNYDQCDNEKLTAALDLLIDDETGECKMKTMMDKVGDKTQTPP
jgi:hypothetical protein